MRHLYTLFKFELRSQLIAPSTYVVSVLFLLLMGYLYFSILEAFNLNDQELLPGEMFFQGFSFMAIIVVPLLTMRSIAEERRRGTLETLMTTPVTAVETVCAKFLAAYTFYALLWGMTLLFPFLTAFLIGRQDVALMLTASGPLLGGILFVLLSGSLFVSIGIFASSLTRSQLVAGMLSFSILFILIIGMPALGEQAQNWQLGIAGFFQHLDVFQHLDEFSRGVVDTRPLLYYLSNACLVLGLASLVVESKV